MSLDLDAIKARADTAHRWIQAAEGDPGGGDGWLPFSVREHFASDVPALLSEVERLRAAEARIRKLVEPWVTNEYMCGDRPAAGRDILRALDGAS